MLLLKQYLDLQKKIYHYFGYVENHRILPIEDDTEFFWFIAKDEAGSGRVVFFKEPPTLISVGGPDHYEYSIYTNRFLKKWVYRASHHTMIVSDTHFDGNKVLAIFSNSREVKHELIIEFERIEHRNQQRLLNARDH